MPSAKVLTLPENARRHTHVHHQVVIGLQGRAELDVEGVGVALDTGTACLVPTEAAHDFHGNPSNHVLVIDVDRDDPAMVDHRHGDYERLAPLFERPRQLLVDDQLHRLIQLCAAELVAASHNPSLHQHFAAGIVHCLSDRIDRAAVGPADHRPGLNVEALHAWIRSRLHMKITTRDLASEACLSVSRFHELFRELTGSSPHQYVIRVRLERVVELLRFSHLPLSEIAFRTGFSSQGALTNAMKKYRGVTPSALRERDRSPNP